MAAKQPVPFASLEMARWRSAFDGAAGGATPWGTWISCEEHRAALVSGFDPSRAGQRMVRPLLGEFPTRPPSWTGTPASRP